MLQNAADALDCRAQLGQRFEGDDYNLTAKITLKTAHLISLREDVDYYCGGAHPDAFTTGLIWERATGRTVPLKALWLKLTPTRQKALYLAAVQPGLDADCQDMVQEMDADFTVNLTEKGVALTPTSLPHVVATCVDTVTIPYAQLSMEAKRHSPYVHDLYTCTATLNTSHTASERGRHIPHVLFRLDPRLALQGGECTTRVK